MGLTSLNVSANASLKYLSATRAKPSFVPGQSRIPHRPSPCAAGASLASHAQRWDKSLIRLRGRFRSSEIEWPALLKMVVAGQDLSQTAFLQEDQRDAVGDRPFLVRPGVKEDTAGLELPVFRGHDLESRVGRQVATKGANSVRFDLPER